MLEGQRRRNKGGVEDRTRSRSEQNRARTGGPQVMMFADDIGICGTNVEQLEENLERWTSAWRGEE